MCHFQYTAGCSLKRRYVTLPTEFLSFASEKSLDDFASTNKTLVQEVQTLIKH